MEPRDAVAGTDSRISAYQVGKEVVSAPGPRGVGSAEQALGFFWKTTPPYYSAPVLTGKSHTGLFCLLHYPLPLEYPG